METQGTFKIAEPCHENWNNMTPEVQGRFCAYCQRCVVDFSKKSQAEVKQIFDQEGGDVCGRIKVSQLRPPRPAIRGFSFLRRTGLKSVQLFALALMAAFTFLIHNPVHAQKDVIMGKMAYVPASNEVEGRVTWDSGQPAIGVHVELQQDGQILATTLTDAKGRYTFSEVRSGIFSIVANDGGGAFASTDVTLLRGDHKRQDLHLHDRVIMGQMMYFPPDTIAKETPLKIENLEPISEILPIEEQPVEIAVIETENEAIAESLDPNESLIVSGFEVKVFPNPTTDKVTLLVEKAGSMDQDLDLRLVSVDGKVVFQGKWASYMENHQTMDMRSLPAGIYILRIQAGDQHVERRLLKI